jgi:putative ubiquitin-RnfH superfamily antitoxin RatB of RatAB toxin-antitoxin module
MIKVEVAYARLDQQWLLSVELLPGSTIHAAILQSGILDECPEINLFNQKVGIFSKPGNLTDILHEGDRIEIYRPLLIDPKEARRTKAKKA